MCEKEGNSHHSRVQDLSHSSGDHNLCGLRAYRDEMRWDGMGCCKKKKLYNYQPVVVCPKRHVQGRLVLGVARCRRDDSDSTLTLTLTRL